MEAFAVETRLTSTVTRRDRATAAGLSAPAGLLPNHVYGCAQLGVEQQRQGDGLPQVVAGYDPDPPQLALIQSVAQKLEQPSDGENGDMRKHIHSSNSCCHHGRPRRPETNVHQHHCSLKSGSGPVLTPDLV